MDPIFHELSRRAGVHFMGVDPSLQAPGVTLSLNHNGLACDAQPSLVTVSSSGIPAFLSTFIDPKLIEILVAPMRAAEIVGEEVKKGDWTTDTAMFATAESTGETSSYDDYSNNGVSGVNIDFPQRQAYLYQTITQWGERELERAGLAKIDYANRLNISSTLALNKYQNKTYFFGVAGLQNYGLLNDPNLYAPIAPTVEAITGNPTTWALKDGLGVYADIQALYTQLLSQQNNAGFVELDTKMTLAMSPASQVALTKVTQYNVNVEDMLKKNFPNLVVKVAPEYATASGNLVQLIVNEVEGQRTAVCAFTEKLRAHPVVIEMSAFKQKKSQGTFGTIIFRPFLIASMLGV